MPAPRAWLSWIACSFLVVPHTRRFCAFAYTYPAPAVASDSHNASVLLHTGSRDQTPASEESSREIHMHVHGCFICPSKCMQDTNQKHISHGHAPKIFECQTWLCHVCCFCICSLISGVQFIAAHRPCISITTRTTVLIKSKIT